MIGYVNEISFISFQIFNYPAELVATKLIIKTPLITLNAYLPAVWTFL